MRGKKQHMHLQLIQTACSADETHGKKFTVITTLNNYEL